MTAASLLFTAGQRPDIAAVRKLARGSRQFSISLDPAAEGSAEPGWVELISNGLTYDLVGLSPAAAQVVAPARHIFGLPQDAGAAHLQAITLMPGPHLASGAAMFPVVRTLAALMADLARLADVVAIAWHPAHTLCDPTFFRTSTQRWIEGGVFPGLGLTALGPAADGGLMSEGLVLFAGAEVHVAPDITPDRNDLAKLALRVMHWLVEVGGIDEPCHLTGPGGEPLDLIPKGNQPIVKVLRAS